VNYLKISLSIFVVLAASRFVPHPPNFTSLIALSFYVPAILGIKFLPALLISFVITDMLIGIHETIVFTWGSIILVGLLSRKLNSNTSNRILGAIFGASLFFLITNFGVWSLGSYGYTLEALITCYTLAIPFFGNTLIATLIFSLLIEIIYNFKEKNFSILKKYN